MSGKKNVAANKEEGNLQDTAPVRDPTEKTKIAPTPLKSKVKKPLKTPAPSAANTTEGDNATTPPAGAANATSKKAKPNTTASNTTAPSTSNTSNQTSTPGEEIPGFPGMPKKLNVTMEGGDEATDKSESESLNPDQFQIDDSKFEWSSRAKILKESLD